MKNTAVKLAIAHQYEVEPDDVNVQFVAFWKGSYEFRVRVHKGNDQFVEFKFFTRVTDEQDLDCSPAEAS